MIENISVGSCYYRKIAIGRSLLVKDIGKQQDLGGGVEAWFGHFQSLLLGRKTFFIVHASQRAFVKPGPVHQLIAIVFHPRVGEPLRDNYKNFSKKIVTPKVYYPRDKYAAKIGCNGIRGAANVERFDCEGKQMTVE